MAQSNEWIELKKKSCDLLQKPGRAFDYVHKYRKIPQEVTKKYNVGVCSHLDVLKIPECPEHRRESFGKINDKQWITFFIEDLEGTPLGVEQRSLDGKDFLKIYFNLAKIHPPFFGIEQALPLLVKTGRLALVEGCIDTLAFATITKFPVLGILTKSPSKTQKRWIMRWASRVSLFLDADDEGQATARTVETTWSRDIPTVNTKWWEAPSLEMRANKDLADILQNQGPHITKLFIDYGLRK